MTPRDGTFSAGACFSPCKHGPRDAVTPRDAISQSFSMKDSLKKVCAKASRTVTPSRPSAGPVLVIDTREQDPLPFARLPAVRGTLATGDYSALGMEHLFAVERKTIPDLVACCCGANRTRFERELHRLRGFRFKRLLIVGERAEVERGDYRSNVKPAAVLGSLAAWEVRFDLPIVFEPTPEAAACRVESWAWYAAREIIETVKRLQKATAAEPEAAP